MPKKTKVIKTSGHKLAIAYPILFAINSITLLLANTIFPEKVVLGTHYIPVSWAIIHSMGTLALINILAIPFIEYLQEKKDIPETKLWIKNLLINFVGIWAITRFAKQLGLGVTSWFITLLLAIVFTITQTYGTKLLNNIK